MVAFGRLACFGYSLLIIAASQALQSVARNTGSVGLVLGAIGLAFMATVAIGFQRCRNLEANSWWTPGMIVPILNFVVGINRY